MQAKMNDGTYGEIMPYEKKGLERMLEDPNVEKVEVFNATEKEMKRRKKLSKKKYGKVPSIKSSRNL